MLSLKLGKRLGFSSFLPFLSMSIASHGLRRGAGKRQGQVLGRESPSNPTTHAQEKQDEHLARCLHRLRDSYKYGTTCNVIYKPNAIFFGYHLLQPHDISHTVVQTIYKNHTEHHEGFGNNCSNAY